jgi:hypothetical protein
MSESRTIAIVSDRAAIHSEWRREFGRPPSKHLSTGFMQSVLTWEMQAKQSAGLPTKIKRALQAIAKGKQPKLTVPRTVAAGTHLVREWNGRTYQVEVLKKGFRMDGREYRSLTAIAKKITSANWSGPRFFGLTQAGANNQ